MGEIATDLVLLYGAFSIFGLPAFLTLAPPLLRASYGSWLTALPLTGIASTITISTFFFGSGVPFSALMPTLLGAATLSVLWDLLRRDDSRLRELIRLRSPHKGLSHDWPFALLFFAACVLALLPCLISGHSTTPFRFGPDGPLYAQAAHYLSHLNPQASYSNIKEFQRTLHWEVGATYPHLVIAAYVLHLRWGFSLLTAFATNLTHAPHPYASMFLLSFLILALGTLMCRLVARRFFSLSGAAAWLCATALIVHSGLLNTLLENQHPNVVFVSFSIVLIALMLNAREYRGSPGAYCFAGLFFSAILSVYSESLPVLGAYFFFVLLFDFAFGGRKESGVTLKFLAFSAALGLLFVAPYTVLVAKHLFALSTQNVGYPQPRWAWPSEIIGLGNAFAGGVQRWTSWQGEPLTVMRSFKDLRWVICATALTLIVAFFGGRRIRPALRNVWLGTIPVILLVLAVSLRGQKHNYLYTKATIMLAPVIVIGFFGALWQVLPKHSSQAKRLGLTCIWTFVTIGFGITYLVDYIREHRVISPQLMRLGTLGLSKEEIILLPDPWGLRGAHTRYVDRTAEMYELSFYRLQAIDPVTFCDAPQLFHAALRHRVFRFQRLDAVLPTAHREENPLFEDRSFTIFDTDYRVGELIRNRRNCSPGIYEWTDKFKAGNSSSR